MRVAVTGAAGYIGSVVVEVLTGEGHDVLAIDNLSKGHRDAIPTAQLLEIDLRNRDRLSTALQAFHCEAAIHLAADSLVGESVTDPSKYYWNNVVSGLTLLDAMRQVGVRRIVFSSTAAVYGEPVRQPIEETDPTNPTNPYGESKLSFERALKWYGQAYGLQSISLRYFNAAGATERCGERHDPETHLIPLVLQTALGLRPSVTVFGVDYPTPDGTCVRDYIHVHDLARAHVIALNALSGSAGRCDVYNLGCGGRGYSVLEVIGTAERVTGQTIHRIDSARRPGDPAVLIASSDRIRRELGWMPRYQDLDTIVSSAWQWMTRSERGVSA